MPKYLDWQAKAEEFEYDSPREMFAKLYAKTKKDRLAGKRNIVELAAFLRVSKAALSRALIKYRIGIAKSGTGMHHGKTIFIPYKELGFDSERELFVAWRKERQMTYAEIQKRLKEAGVSMSITSIVVRCSKYI